MTVIAKNDANAACAPLWTHALDAVQAHIQATGAHPARTVVLVPYAQLMAEAQRQWARRVPDGFAPRFETTRNWAQQLGGFVPQGLDLAMDVARDSLTARSLLAQAGLGAEQDMLAAPLLEAATQLAPVAAAISPAERAAWAETQRALLGLAGEGSTLRYEAVVARIALEWVAASRHACDVLFEPGVRAAVDALVVLEGFQPDPLAGALRAAWGACALAWPLHAAQPPGELALHPAQDAEDEAQRAAACVLAHVQAGRVPVALASTDRALVRRIGALLAGAYQPVRDENGWTLSTTRAAAQVLAPLRACAWSASTDAVLDWVKQMPAVPELAQRALEKWLRRHTLAAWRDAVASGAPAAPPEVAAVLAQIEALRRPLRADRSLADWMQALQALLQASGQWQPLAADAAGARVLLELRLGDAVDARSVLDEGPGPVFSLQSFTRWVDEVLEAARFKPEGAPGVPAEVVVLPLSQLLGRPFAALVLPGCDEKRLQAAPEPPGQWTPAQRQALGLPTRAALEAAQRAAWAHALGQPRVDILWRASEGGEPLLASPLVLALQQPGQPERGAQGCADPRVPRHVAPTPVARPGPDGAALPLVRLSASAYADLRHCPYRFYALRLLGLQESDELDATLDKRDFGTWLHAVLQHFHEALRDAPEADRVTLMDEAATRATRDLRLHEADFLPYASGWPALRSGYLDWLARHEAEGATFREAEVRTRQPLGALELVGTLDRVDMAGGAPLVIDYKTESDSATRQRIQAGGEDTQLAFYAALMPDDHLRAAYVNVGERGETQLHEQPDVVALRDQLIEGILGDMARIAEGAPLPALGEGSVCEWCAVRGLCRKDFWNA